MVEVAWSRLRARRKATGAATQKERRNDRSSTHPKPPEHPIACPIEFSPNRRGVKRNRRRDTQQPGGTGSGYQRPGVAGSGTIACGLAAAASVVGEVRLLARSDASAWRAEEIAQGQAKKVEGGRPERIRVTTDPADLADRDLIVEAVTEDAEVKGTLLAELAARAPRPTSRARRRRSRSTTWRIEAAPPSASSASTSSTR